MQKKLKTRVWLKLLRTRTWRSQFWTALTALGRTSQLIRWTTTSAPRRSDWGSSTPMAREATTAEAAARGTQMTTTRRKSTLKTLTSTSWDSTRMMLANLWGLRQRLARAKTFHSQKEGSSMMVQSLRSIWCQAQWVLWKTSSPSRLHPPESPSSVQRSSISNKIIAMKIPQERTSKFKIRAASCESCPSARSFAICSALCSKSSAS